MYVHNMWCLKSLWEKKYYLNSLKIVEESIQTMNSDFIKNL